MLDFNLILKDSAEYQCALSVAQETQRQSCEVLWEAVKNGQYNVVQEAVFNMALKETTSFLWDSQRNGKTMLGLAVE